MTTPDAYNARFTGAIGIPDSLSDLDFEDQISFLVTARVNKKNQATKDDFITETKVLQLEKILHIDDAEAISIYEDNDIDIGDLDAVALNVTDLTSDEPDDYLDDPDAEPF